MLVVSNFLNVSNDFHLIILSFYLQVVCRGFFWGSQAVWSPAGGAQPGPRSQDWRCIWLSGWSLLSAGQFQNGDCYFGFISLVKSYFVVSADLGLSLISLFLYLFSRPHISWRSFRNTCHHGRCGTTSAQSAWRPCRKRWVWPLITLTSTLMWMRRMKWKRT